jgi:hypothetical protein
MENGELSRERMVETIQSGGSVMVGGQIITSVAGLPDTAESIAQAEAELEDRKAKAETAKKDTAKKGK